MIRTEIVRCLLEYSKENDIMLLTKYIAYAARDTGRDETSDEWDPTVPSPISDPEEVKSKTLSRIRDLLNTRRLKAGQLADGGIAVDPWRIPVDAVIERVDRAWAAIGTEPGLEHDIVWLGPCRPEEWPHSAPQ